MTGVIVSERPLLEDSFYRFPLQGKSYHDWMEQFRAPLAKEHIDPT